MMRRQTTGFTLMELIGVMAIMAILSAALAPSVFDLINDAYADQEIENLETLAANLETYLQQTKTLPSSNRNVWSAALANVSDLPVERVLRNRRGFLRTLYFDPRFLTTGDSNFGGFTQSTGLAIAPPSPRVMLISDLNGNAPQPSMSTAVFDAIWNQDAGATVIESSDLQIVRLNLGDHFHRVTLVNSATSQAGFSLDGGARAAIAANNGATDGIVERYIVVGTRLELYADPFPVGTLATAAQIGGARGYRYATDGLTWSWSET